MIYISSLAVAAIAILCFSDVGAQEAPEEECWINEARYSCGKLCEERCNAPAPPSCGNGIQCGGPSCRCKDGFARNPGSNQCIAKANCPVNPCAVGESKGACGKTCEGTCESPRIPEICSRISCFNPSCRCDLDGGFVRNSDGECVRIEDCLIQD